MDILKLAEIIFNNADTKQLYEGIEEDLEHIQFEIDEFYEAVIYDQSIKIKTEQTEEEGWDIIFMTISFMKKYGYFTEEGLKRNLKKILER